MRTDQAISFRHAAGDGNQSPSPAALSTLLPKPPLMGPTLFTVSLY